MRKLGIVTAFALLGLAPQALAAGFDGSKDLLCASLQAIECDPAEACTQGPAHSVNAPQFFRISFADQAVRAIRPDQSELNTEIRSVTRDQGGLVLQGVENGRGWSAALSEETGRVVVSVSGDDVAFILFGACTPMP